jgi:predicted ATPase
LLNALRARGHATTGDAARALVAADPQVREDDVAFQEAILAREIEAYDAARGRTFFDRGIPDVAAGFAMTGRAVPAHVDAAARAYRYDRTVFVAPPWRAIYVNDAERVQTYDHAVAVYAAVVATYRRYGYDVVDLPLASVAERVTFVERQRPGSPEGSPGH